MKKPVILYHENCPDGFGAAFAAWKKFGNKAEYYQIPASQTEHQLDSLSLKGREIYFLDTCVSFPMLLKLRMTNERVTVIDHHETNAPHVARASEHVFDTKHSGAVLAWRYFHPKKAVPLLFKYVEDSDFWKFTRPHASELTTYAYALPFDFKVWDTLTRDFESARKRQSFIEKGKAILGYQTGLIESILKKSTTVQFGKYRVLAVNSSAKPLSSALGHELVEKVSPLGIVWYVKGGELNVSLRGNGTVDVSKLAKQFPGGGGHPNAAGFSVPLAKGFPWKVVESR